MYAITRTFEDGTVKISPQLIQSEFEADKELIRVKRFNTGIKCKVVKLVDWLE